jgi:hypothetical protein
MEDKRIKEISEERFNTFGEGKTCEGCMFAYGDTPMDDAPDKCSCTIYPYPKTKPDNVFLEGGHCKYRRDR